uniref:ubiquitinyl hydrolase 1 n=1 Tax=Globisporangium ultimum (strain ATCC 200006 / CBS 805.95 / DAOM BR144) TaxID=431595 RepID=K3WZ92_GLOUD
MDEFLRAVAILRCGSMDDKIMFVFHMCDLDHAGKVQSTGLSNFLVSLHGRQILERPEYRRLLSDGFDQGRARMSMEEFAKVVPELEACSILVDWMDPFVDILCETANPQLLESQEEFNPVVQQKILANETRFSIKEVSILQDAFNNYRVSGGGDAVDMDALTSDFPLEMSEERFARVFSSFGSRATGTDIDVFSFVNALAIACRGTTEEKAKFAFTLFATLSSDTLMSRDDLYGMLRLDLAQNSDLEDHVLTFIEENVKTRSYSKSMTASSKSLVDLIDGRIPSVSGSELGIFVDHIMKKYGKERVIFESEEVAADETPVLTLTLEEFTACTKQEHYEMASLRIMREVAFIDLGLVPEDKEEELRVAKGCYKEYEPSALVEDDQWFLIEAKWFDHWCKYIKLPVSEVEPPASNSGIGSATSLADLQSKLTVANTAKTSKDPPIMDADGNYLRPKGINNYLLLTGDRRDRVLKSADDIKLGKHFVVICEQLWMALKLWYGGGPEIRRAVVMQSNGVPILDIWEDALKKKKDEEDDDSTTPSDGEKQKKIDALALPRRMRSGGSVGLSNLGNTCYMNSALQCLSNTQLLAEYFLSGMYLDDINRTSTLGLQGKLAEVFGKLAEDMWCAKQKSISPRNFKKTIGKFNEAFRGSDQQDSQELLAFLLSGLSEDLNRITDKPYVEQPDSDGRYDADLADEWWRNHLRREVSIIVALFTGQYKSLLTCSVCGFKSARFEPFTFLQVPLPEPTHNTVTVLLVLANGMTPMKVSVRLTISATIFDLKHELMNMCHTEFDLPNITEADIKLCEFSGSMILSFKADNRRIGQIRSIDRLIAFQLEPLDTDIAQATRHRRPSYIPTGPGATRVEEVESEKYQKFYENLTKGALVEVRTRAQSHDFVPGVVIDCPENPTAKEDDEPQILVRLRRGDEEMMVPLNRLRPRQARLLYVPLVSRKLSYSAVYFKNPFRPMPFGIPNLVRICPERTTGYDLYKLVWERVKDYVKAPAPKIWDEHILQNTNALVSNHIDDIFSGLNASSGFLLRRVENKGLTDARSSWLTRSFGFTIPCTNDLLDIMEEETIAIDWDLQVFQDRVLIDRMKHIESHSSVAKNEAIDKGPVPLKHCLDAFTSEEKISEGYCSSCRTHVEMTKKLEIWRLPPVMVVHLKRFQYTQTYRRKLASLVEFPIEGLDLSCCVAPHEEFPEKYPMKRSKDEPVKKAVESKTNGAATENGTDVVAKPDAPETDTAKVGDKAEENAEPSTVPRTGSVPNAKVMNRARRGYTNTNLDQSRCLETNYDLYGVVNHQGALGGGHYTAYAKNFVDDQWYYYDDERVRVVEESRVVSPSAYLLFYLRSDMKGMLVKDMFPQNKNGKITEEDIERFVDQGDERRCTIM